MNEFLTITCPHCGETFEIAADPGEEEARFIVDCEVCCRPLTVRVRMRNGEIDDARPPQVE